MNEEIEAFLAQIPEVDSISSAELIDYFVYFLTIVKEKASATPKEIEKCFIESKITPYSNIPSYLSKHCKRQQKKKPKFLKINSGYQLERTQEQAIAQSLKISPARNQTYQTLNDLLEKLTDREEKEFLQEVIDCYNIDARRAAIVLVWILTLHHLYKYILRHKKIEFNAVLGKVRDKRVKVSSVNSIDDFSDIPESNFIEIARTARIITNDIRKILDVKLGIRNTSAHPSAVMISQVKVTDFIIDLIQNVILKYNL